MPVSDPSGGSRGQRPRYEPRSKARVRYYKASMVLAIVFLALVVVLPVWLDLLRRADDREALKRPLESRAVLSGSAPLPASVPGTTPTRETIRRLDVVNTDCRGHVYARCNALRIGPRDCVEIAAEAIAVPVEGGHAACLEVVEPLLAARTDPAAAAAASAAPGATPSSAPAAAQAPGTEGQAAPAEGTPATNGATGGTTAPATGTGAPGDDAPAGEAATPQDGEGTPGAAPAAGPAAGAGESGLSPRERADRLSRMRTIIDEFQRGTYNYATPPAVQAGRMAELRTLVDEVGTDDAKALYNRMLETYRTPPAVVPLEPVPGGYVGDAPRVEVGVTDRSPTSTPELDTVGAWADAAHREAGLPSPAAEPAPGQAVAPTATVGSEIPETSIDSTAPAAAGFVESVRP